MRKMLVLFDNFPRSVRARAFKSVILFHLCTETILNNLTQHAMHALTTTHLHTRAHTKCSESRRGRHASLSGGLPMALPFPLALSVGLEHLPQAEL